MHLPTVISLEALIALIKNLHFLPLFQNEIPGFSVEDCTPEELWFEKDVDGPWEWKGPAIIESHCAYGKFFGNKAAFISRDWFPDFANYRRNGYDFDARFEDGLSSYKDKLVYDTLNRHDSLLSKALKEESGFGRGGEKGFDSIMTRLQMQGYIITTNFEYRLDRYGKAYGWGIARYATPEHHFGTDFSDQVYRREPEASKERILTHLSSLLPHVTKQQILNWLK